MEGISIEGYLVKSDVKGKDFGVGIATEGCIYNVQGLIFYKAIEIGIGQKKLVRLTFEEVQPK